MADGQTTTDGQAATYEVECPHCHRGFEATVIPGRAARYRGFKCPHCKLFVPYERADERDLVERAEQT